MQNIGYPNMKNFYCPLPFRHVFLESRGVKPCCSYTEIYRGSIQDWLASDELQNLQQEIIKGTVPAGCKSCIDGERRDGTSTRLGALKDYPDLIVTDTDIDYIDYRASNVCNFRCRSCNPYFSYRIAQEAKENIQLNKFYPIPDKKFASTTEYDKKWIIDHLPNIKRLMFTGGEPTRIQEVKEIIKIVMEKQYNHVNIQMITNGSFTDPFWFEVTKNYPRIHWTVSIDAVGKFAEIIRDGTDWSLVESNTKILFDISPSVNVGTVITNLNINHLDRLFDYVNELSRQFSHRQNGRTQFIEICNWPQHMNPYNWPDDKKMQLLQYLDSINQHNLQENQKQTVQNLIEQLAKKSFDQALWDKSIAYNTILDKIRDQDHTQLLSAYKYPAKEDIIHASK